MVRTGPGSRQAAVTTAIAAWEDDPVSAVPETQPPAKTPVTVAEPDLDPPHFAVGVDGTRPAPGVHAVGTPEFRWWNAAEAMARGAWFWVGRVPRGVDWQPSNGSRLIAHLDDGDDLNAYYDRNGLHFFHGTVGGTTVYSGESPDVVCHELGHAVLDAVKPQLWGAASIEAAAFHESFADCSAILSNLQVGSLREAVLIETDGRFGTASRLTRMAEDLGWAIRRLSPDGVAPDCLRSAVNSFYYQDPATLPPSAPASSLSSEPHNFSRVFTGGFFRVLSGIFRLQSEASADTLRTATEDAGTLLVEGIRRSPVVPGLYAQVAAHMVEADEELFGRRYRKAILSGFVRSGVLSVRSAATLGGPGQVVTAVAAADLDGRNEIARLPLAGTAFGLPADLMVQAASNPRRFSVAGGVPDVGETVPAAPERAAGSFVEDLLRRGRISAAADEAGAAPIDSHALTTHVIRAGDEGLELFRTRVDCGFADFGSFGGFGA